MGMTLKNSSLNDQSGALHLPLGAVIALAALAVLAFLSVARHWTVKVRAQLDLDRCTGETALTLRKTLEDLESRNRQLEALRAAQVMAIATGNAPLIKANQGGMLLIVQLQNAAILRWKKRQLAWPARKECGGPLRSEPLPEIPISRPLPDSLGEKPLTWTKPAELLRFKILAKRKGRSSSSFVFKTHRSASSFWTASWRSPDA